MINIDDISLQQIDITNKVDELVVSCDCEVVDEIVEFRHFELDAFDPLLKYLIEICFIFVHLDLLLSRHVR